MIDLIKRFPVYQKSLYRSDGLIILPIKIVSYQPILSLVEQKHEPPGIKLNPTIGEILLVLLQRP